MEAVWTGGHEGLLNPSYLLSMVASFKTHNGRLCKTRTCTLEEDCDNVGVSMRQQPKLLSFRRASMRCRVKVPAK